mmetsp:Transcript_31177/g.68214  ORF Transcript_31177/g.68214 Transcript_31177/m.68214 type:complete len:80 (-) Transcript_31177:66-305(-)
MLALGFVILIDRRRHVRPSPEPAVERARTRASLALLASAPLSPPPARARTCTRACAEQEGTYADRSERAVRRERVQGAV